nr:DUF5040 domain-containing protein [Dysgonomonas sp. Marseille-P4677]
MGVFSQNRRGQTEKIEDKYTIFLTGASFASSNNGWFELACKDLNAKPINRAVGGTAIVDAANLMAEGKLYTTEELEVIDAFVIMHVHDQDVADISALKDNYKDYKTPFDRSNYAIAYDYLIKRYITECYNLKFDATSKYYGTKSGKPAIIIFCTHWHDARIKFNSSIRILGQRWGLPIVEFDKYIGFSKNHLHPVTKMQYSILYAHNNETINGVDFGWHPYEGQDKYVQQRMAAIFTELMRKVLPSR